MDRDHKDRVHDMDRIRQKVHIPSLPDESPPGRADLGADEKVNATANGNADVDADADADADANADVKSPVSAARADGKHADAALAVSAYPARPGRRRRRRRLILGHTAFSIGSWVPLVVVVVVLSGPVLWLVFVMARQVHSHYLPNVGISSSLLSSSSSLLSHGELSGTSAAAAAAVAAAAVGGLVANFDHAVAQCAVLGAEPPRPQAGSREGNPRWEPANGQKQRIVLRNATLFDGEEWHPTPMDVLLDRGVVAAVVESTADSHVWEEEGEGETTVFHLHGRYVTPGLVDMHTHHFVGAWPATGMGMDGDEVHPDTKAFVPMVHVIDALKPYDIAARLIASGGVTSSLALPGSETLMGGEAVAVKNVLRSGKHAEPTVRDLLLERGVPHSERRRYMKMALGENPKTVWGYTRLGNAWHLREHLQKAKDLKDEQDEYCLTLAEVRRRGTGGSGSVEEKAMFVRQNGKFPFSLELESTVGVLRGQVHVHNHNYEPEDMETMLRISKEYGFRVRAFHHATGAWQVPELLKELGHNVTIATFAELHLYKQEAYDASLYAGHVLDRHDIPVAYKSDHYLDVTNARYLMTDASTAYAFRLPENKALQSVTSVPAKAMDLDFRIGYCRPSYDADLVVWDDHPLAVAATPLQVFIDGIPQLGDDEVREAMGTTFTAKVAKAPEGRSKLQVRTEPTEAAKEEFCSVANKPGRSFIITGIRKALLENHPLINPVTNGADGESLQLVISNGVAVCLGSEETCAAHSLAVKKAGVATELRLENGYVAPGLTALTRGLGMREIGTLDSTGDGEAGGQRITDPESINYAKYGVWLDGKSFARARLGGVTRAVSPPLADSAGLVTGVSVQIVTSGRKTLMDGGILQEDVALHLSLGDRTKISEGTVGDGIKHIRKMLKDGKGQHKETIFGKVASGELPLVVECDNKYDLSQLILVKRDYPRTRLVILGAKEAPYVAKELAAAKIPIILSQDRGAPSSFRHADAVVGPPLTRSIGAHLVEAGIQFGVAISISDAPGDFKIHKLGPEAWWTAKNAGLSELGALALVTVNIEAILGLKPSADLVVFEGSPLRYGATVVLSFHGDSDTGRLEVGSCFPGEM